MSQVINSPENTSKACSCDYLLDLSSADCHETLRKRLISIIEALIPGSLSIIYDKELHNLILSDKKGSPSEHAHSITHQITSDRGEITGEINIYSDQAITDDQKTSLINAFKLYSHVNQLMNLSHYDALTQVLNRQSFDTHLAGLYKQALSEKRRNHEQVNQHVLAMLDIDHFKRVNDSYGHLLGDEVLILISQILKRSLRDNDLIFRFGGEEFVLIITDCTLEQAETSIKRTSETIANYTFPQLGKLTVSMGYCTIDTDVNYDLLLERSDTALYYVKEHGRNSCKSYEELLSKGEINRIDQRSGEIELF